MRKVLITLSILALLCAPSFAANVMSYGTITPVPADDYLYVIDNGTTDGKATISSMITQSETLIESLLELQSLQGAITDGQVPDNITITESDPLVDTAAEILAIMDDTALDFGTGVLTATGFSGPLTGAVTGNASTASALAANGGNCGTATHFAVGVNAAGVAECEAIADADVPDDITITETDPNALLTAGTNNVNDTHIDWGVGANQVSRADLPAKQQVLNVCKSGCAYSVIQTAIDAIGDNAVGKPYVVKIYPGTYAETITMEDFVSLDGEGRRDSIVIDGSVTFAAVDSDQASIKDLSIIETTATDGFALVTIPANTGDRHIDHVFLSLTDTTNGDAGNLVDLNGGDLTIKRSDFFYNYDGTAAGNNPQYVVDITGTSSYDIYDCQFDVDVADEDDNTVVINEAAAGTAAESFIHNNIIHMNLSHGTYNNIAGVFWLHGAGAAKSIERNHIHVTSDGGGIGYIIAMDTAADNGVIHSIGNWGEITGFATNISATMAAGDTLNGTFVRLKAANGAIGAGIYNTVASTTDGALTVSAAITNAALTASEIVITDASKVLSSAAVATYPSLAELAWLKGMTSKVIDDDQIDTFSELNTIVADKTLVNEEDAVTWDAAHTFSSTINNITITTPAASGTLTIADGKTFTATNTVNINTLTDGKWCTYTAAGTVLNCTEDAPVGTGDITDVWNCSTGDCNTLTIGDNEYLIGGAVTGTGDPYISLPQGADVSTVSGEGYISWDSDGDVLYVGTGAAALAIGGAETNSLETLTTGIATTEIPIGTAANTVVYAALSGDVTMTNGGVVSIGNEKIDSDMYVDASIALAHMSSQSVDSDNIVQATIVTGDIHAAAGITLAQTAMTAGRSLTIATNNVIADEETYIYKAKVAIIDPVATDDFVFGELSHAVTFTSIYCKTLVGTVTLDVTSGGTDIAGTDIVCDTDGQSDAGITNAAGSASDEIKLAITEVASAPTYLFLQLNGTQDD